MKKGHKVPKKVCDLCGKIISFSNFEKHYGSKECIKNKSKKISSFKVSEKGLYICPYCEKEYSNKGIKSHIWRMHTDKGKKHDPGKGIVAWNKGLTKMDDSRLAHSDETKKKIGEKSKGRNHTKETKQKLSKSLTKYLKENPDKVPYLLNHSSKQSYPEAYFEKFFSNEGFSLEYHKQISLYQLDFYNKDKKIDIEIDGEQHYLDKKIVKSDIKRNIFLNEKGISTIRIRWSKWQKLTTYKKKKYVKFLKEYIDRCKSGQIEQTFNLLEQSYRGFKSHPV